MNVSLTPELEKFVEDTVATGRFNSASEVVRAALRTFEQEQDWIAYAKQKIAAGMADMEAGRFITSDEFEARLKERKKKRA